jgi:nitrile hydratase subunit beta
MGGMHGFGPVAPGAGEQVFQAAWQPRIFALHMVISNEGLAGGPDGRATRETMPPAEYLAASYYERWLWSAERRLELRGTIAPGEVEQMMARLAAGEPVPSREDARLRERALASLHMSEPMNEPDEARFATGDRVRVARMHPAGHSRCPRYVRGVLGEIRGIRGADALPDRSVPEVGISPEPVYSVAFDSPALWGPAAEPPFTVVLDLWQSYLEPA